MSLFAECLPVVLIPEQLLVASVRLDVIHGKAKHYGDN
jgi:hypothetical protein